MVDLFPGSLVHRFTDSLWFEWFTGSLGSIVFWSNVSLVNWVQWITGFIVLRFTSSTILGV